jgi:hypothetical protein
LPTLCSIDQAEKYPHRIRQWFLHAVELIAFGLTNGFAFAFGDDHDWPLVALPHVALPQIEPVNSPAPPVSTGAA